MPMVILFYHVIDGCLASWPNNFQSISPGFERHHLFLTGIAVKFIFGQPQCLDIDI